MSASALTLAQAPHNRTTVGFSVSHLSPSTLITQCLTAGFFSDLMCYLMFSAKIDSLVLAVHKTLMIDWLTYMSQIFCSHLS